MTCDYTPPLLLLDTPDSLSEEVLRDKELLPVERELLPRSSFRQVVTSTALAVTIHLDKATERRNLAAGHSLDVAIY